MRQRVQPDASDIYRLEIDEKSIKLGALTTSTMVTHAASEAEVTEFIQWFMAEVAAPFSPDFKAIDIRITKVIHDVALGPNDPTLTEVSTAIN